MITAWAIKSGRVRQGSWVERAVNIGNAHKTSGDKRERHTYTHMG